MAESLWIKMETSKEQYPVGTVGYLANQIVADMRAAKQKSVEVIPPPKEPAKRVSKRRHFHALRLEKPNYSTNELRSLKNGAIGSNALLSNMFVVSRALPPTAWSANDDSGDVYIQTEDIPEVVRPPTPPTVESESRSSRSHRRRRSRKRSSKKRRSRDSNEQDTKRRKGN